MQIGIIIKKLRKEKDITQEQLASHLNISRSTIAGYETKCHQPDYETLQKIAEFFEVTLDYLVSGNLNPYTRQIEPINETALNHEINCVYRQLSPSSKQELLKYMKLLLLQEKETDKE